MTNSPERESKIIEFASDDELWLAAVALVDAAIYCQAARGTVQVLSEDERWALVEAVYQDPMLAASLFEQIPRLVH